MKIIVFASVSALDVTFSRWFIERECARLKRKGIALLLYKGGSVYYLCREANDKEAKEYIMKPVPKNTTAIDIHIALDKPDPLRGRPCKK